MFETQLQFVVRLRIPRDDAGWSNWQKQCDLIDSGIFVFAQDLLADDSSRQTIRRVTQLCCDSRSIRRGRFTLQLLLDAIQMCRFAAHKMAEEADRCSDRCEDASTVLSMLSGVHPRHPMFGERRKAHAERELNAERAARFSQAADLLSMMAAGIVA